MISLFTLYDIDEVLLLAGVPFHPSLDSSKPKSEANGRDALYGITHAKSHNPVNVRALASDKATN